MGKSWVFYFTKKWVVTCFKRRATVAVPGTVTWTGKETLLGLCDESDVFERLSGVAYQAGIVNREQRIKNKRLRTEADNILKCSCQAAGKLE